MPSRIDRPLFGGFDLVRRWVIHYTAHDGLRRRAFVVLPRWYGPRNHPPLPLIISPHGRGVPALDNVRLWGNLAAVGRTNLAARFYAFPLLRFGVFVQHQAVTEVGAPPRVDPRAWAIRSPIDWARQIAFSGVPLQIWWS